MSIDHRRVALSAIRTAVALLFLYSAYSKATISTEGPTLYQHWTASYPSLRYIMPGFEAFLGVWLLAGIKPQIALLLTIVMVSGFSGLLVAEMTKAYPKPCGCMGAAAAAYDPITIRKELMSNVLRNALVIAGACYSYFALVSVQLTQKAVCAAS